MKRMRRLAAVLVAWGGTISATGAMAANYDYGTSSQSATSAELSKLAEELAQTAARLAALEDQQRTEARPSDSQGSTVRWLTDQPASAEPSATFTAGPKPRPALQSFHVSPTALAAPARSSIIRVQATEDALDPVPEPNPWEDSLPPTTSGSVASGAGSCCDTCCEPSCDGSCDACEPSCDSCCDVCCEPSCDGCCDTCCGPAKCKRPCIVTVATEVVFLGADINGERVSYLFEDNIAEEIAAFGPDFGDAAIDDLYVAPRLTVGVTGERWGIQGRYFHFRAAEHAHDPILPEGAFPLDSFDINTLFEAYYTDVELTRNFCIHGCKGQFSFGARYAAIEFHESLYARSFASSDPMVLADPNSPMITGYGRSNREARGTGMTFGLTGRKPLFCNACAHWFYSARGSILWGPTSNEAETEATATGLGLAARSIDGASSLVDDDLFIGEVQAGLEWDFALRCLPAKAFFRVAGEYQYWDASSGFAFATSNANIFSTGVVDQQATVAASAPGLIVDLYGFHVATGFTW